MNDTVEGQCGVDLLALAPAREEQKPCLSPNSPMHLRPNGFSIQTIASFPKAGRKDPDKRSSLFAIVHSPRLAASQTLARSNAND